MSNEISIIFILITLISAGLIIFFISRRRPSSLDPANTQLLSLINDLRREIQDSTSSQRKEVEGKLDLMHDRMIKNMQDSSSALQKHFQHSFGVFRDVTERLTKLDETNKQVLNFSEQLQSLENILKNPKQRGILGEYWLEALLGQVLSPNGYQMQYPLGVDETTGQKLIPDAVLFVKDLLIPIDAKFSLENYNRISQETDAEKRELLEKEFKTDVKLRIDETSKYVKPQMGTTNFAFMFVPAEGVYHNLITQNVGAVKVNTRNLIEYAFEKGVMIVSPTSFFAYLQTVLLGLKALQIEDSVKDIQKQAENLMRHMKAYEDHHNRLGKQLETTIRTYTSSSQELKKIDKDIYRITEGTAGKEMEPIELSVPASENN
ncbi:MAG: DNA recombination protein RmuC [Candidatus Uhrbacteria bacterium]|nr:DNA recombination protein RmuC [Candidatus Uhrbacteria bacterium]